MQFSKYMTAVLVHKAYTGRWEAASSTGFCELVNCVAWSGSFYPQRPSELEGVRISLAYKTMHSKPQDPQNESQKEDYYYFLLLL